MIDVVLDVDTGVDDALAILLACSHPEVSLRAITCVAGNTNVDQVVANTRAVLGAAGRSEVPLGRGAASPLVGTHRHASHFHGADGLGDLGLAAMPPTGGAEPAIELLRRTVLGATRPISLVCLGPLTNIALLVRQYPEVASRLERVICMAGSLGTGNASAVAEFNVWHDPEAAAICFASELPITMYGLEVFTAVGVPADEVGCLSASAAPTTALAGQLLGYLGDACCKLGTRLADEEIGIGDAGALCGLIDPDGLVVERYPVEVELAGTCTRGQTVVDRRGHPGESELHAAARCRPVIDVAVGVDARRYGALFLEALYKAT